MRCPYVNLTVPETFGMDLRLLFKDQKSDVSKFYDTEGTEINGNGPAINQVVVDFGKSLCIYFFNGPVLWVHPGYVNHACRILGVAAPTQQIEDMIQEICGASNPISPRYLTYLHAEITRLADILSYIAHAMYELKDYHNAVPEGNQLRRMVITMSRDRYEMLHVLKEVIGFEYDLMCLEALHVAP